MDYVDLKESLRGMETEDEQETLRREACEQQLEDDTEIETESNSDSLCDPVDDEQTGSIRQIVNPLLDNRWSFHGIRYILFFGYKTTSSQGLLCYHFSTRDW